MFSCIYSYNCLVDGDKQRTLGKNLANHYKNSANWDAFRGLKAAVGDKELKRLKERADPHTLFLFENGYSEDKLPHWQSHALVRSRAGGPLAQFFKVQSLSSLPYNF